MNIFRNKYQARQAFSLVELVLVLVIILLIIGFASLPAVRIIERSRIDSDAGKMNIFLRESVQYAVLKGKNVRIMLDVDNGIFEAYETYQPLEFGTVDQPENNTQMENRNSDADNETAEPQTEFEDDRETEFMFECEPMELNYLEYILTEDGLQHNSGELFFEAGPDGWKEAFVITITDHNDQYSNWLKCERLTATVKKYKSETELPLPVDNF